MVPSNNSEGIVEWWTVLGPMGLGLGLGTRLGLGDNNTPGCRLDGLSIVFLVDCHGAQATTL